MSDSDIVQDFLGESYENLDRLDRELVGLEKNPHDRDALGSVFRTIHTIKSTCGLLGDAGEVDQSDSLVYFPEDREAGFILPCTGKPRSALKVPTHQQKQMREFRKQKRLLAPYSWSTE
jgi:hypothetical protein